ncbi:BTAD domain-containing putative transcriptional regulator [Sphaerisporangium sp. NPDC005289]|uniref:AfsR/SARP family transcriptional regulator n=1 Tax=Sphaerisporangium sp. NPDC005289 TaxID=3155247 RepID=UPI0033BCE603
MVIDAFERSAGDPPIDFRMLGPLAVETAGVERVIGGPRERTALAMLLLERNQVVPRDRLIEAVWADDPPSTCHQQVQTCISLLRRSLALAGAAHVIETRRPGYRLLVEDRQVDQSRFDALVAAGRRSLADDPATAERLLREALGLWRGRPLADIDSPLVRKMTFTLAEAECAAAEDWFDALLALGRVEEVCLEAAALVVRQPLRERLLRQHITALYRAGRTADALAAYRRARDLFVEELGVEPGPQLQDVQRAILEHDAGQWTARSARSAQPPSPPVTSAVTPPATSPATSAVAPPVASPVASPVAPAVTSAVPRQLPRFAGDLTGREHAVARLRAHLSSGATTAPIAALNGPGGAGKTALAIHVAHLIGDRFPDGQLYVTFGGGGRRRRWTDVDVLERLLRSLGVPGAGIPHEVDDRLSLYRTIIAGRRLLLVLDDAADEGDVRELLPATPGCAAIVTSRPRLTGLDDVLHVDVDVLGPSEGVRLLLHLTGRRIGAGELDATRSLVDLCGGMPLALQIAGARLAARPHWTVAGFAARLESERRRLDELAHGDLAVRPSMALSYASLGAQARRMFRRLGVLEVEDFAAWVAAPLLGTTMDEAAEVLEDLVGARLVEVGGNEQRGPRYRMHELLRVFSRERLAAEESADDRTSALARLLGCLLHLAEEARRRYYGGPDQCIIRSEATRVPLDAASVNALVSDGWRWMESEHPLLVTAVTQAARAGLTELSWDIANASLTLFEVGAHLNDWRSSATVALQASRRAGDRRGEAVMELTLGELGTFHSDPHTTLRHMATATRLFEAIGERHGHAQAVRGTASAMLALGRLVEAADGFREAQRLIAPIDNPSTKLHILYKLALIEIGQGRLDRADAPLLEGLASADDRIDRRVKLMLSQRLGEIYLERGEWARATQVLRPALSGTQAAGDRIGEVYLRLALGRTAARMGDMAEAEAQFTTALDMAHRLCVTVLHGRLLLALGQVYAAGDRRHLAEPLMLQALAVFRDRGLVLFQVSALEALGLLHRSAGDRDGAEAAWQQALHLISTLRGGDGTGLSARLVHRLSTLSSGVPSPDEHRQTVLATI